MALVLIWLLAVVWGQPVTFKQRWPEMPPAMSLETLQAARKAAARPSFCQWDFPGTPCRVI
jgi:hypothetical protein